MGAHPLHQRCLELYSCLASACRVCARRGAGVAALRRAALYGLLQAAAAEAMLAVGEAHLAAERTASCMGSQGIACYAASQALSTSLRWKVCCHASAFRSSPVLAVPAWSLCS